MGQVSRQLNVWTAPVHYSNYFFTISEETLAVGTVCKNAGCQEAYRSEESSFETCQHHTGVPIFHEGMKYWSCCQKKTSDFSTFLAQSGCTSGKHLWIKKKEAQENTDNTCRFDWFQFGSNVVVSIYSKVPITKLCYVRANSQHLQVSLTYGQDRKLFKRSFNLFGEIDLKRSSVSFSPAKTEITMRKADLVQWPVLETDE